METRFKTTTIPNSTDMEQRKLTDHGWSERPARRTSTTVRTSTNEPTSFHDVQPNPLIQQRTSQTIVWPSLKQVLGVSTAIVASIGLWRLYRSWTRNPDRSDLKNRHRLKEKFSFLPDDSSLSTPGRLWRFFFGSSASTSPPPPPTTNNNSPSKTRKSGSSKRSAASREKKAKAKKSFLAKMFTTHSPSSDTETDTSSPSSPQKPLYESGNHHADQLSSSERFRLFLQEVKDLAAHPTHPILIPRPTEFWMKCERIREDNTNCRNQMDAAGENGEQSATATTAWDMMILCSFDRTLTTLKQRHSTSEALPSIATTAAASSPIALTSQSILNIFLPPSYDSAFNLLFQQYYPQETSQHIAPEEKDKYMREWWRRAQSLLLMEEHKLTRQKLKFIIHQARHQGLIALRSGVDQLFHLSHSLSIPMVILSGSIHDVIEEWISQELGPVDGKLFNANSIEPNLSPAERQALDSSQTILLANRMLWTAGTGGIGTGSKYHARDESRSLSSSGSPSILTRGLSSSVPASPMKSPSTTTPYSSSSTVTCFGFDQAHVVHSLNKSMRLILDQPPAILSRVACKKHVILLGSTIQDAYMADGVEEVKHAWQQQLWSHQVQEEKDQAETEEWRNSVSVAPSSLDSSYIHVPHASVPTVSSPLRAASLPLHSSYHSDMSVQLMQPRPSRMSSMQSNIETHVTQHHQTHTTGRRPSIDDITASYLEVKHAANTTGMDTSHPTPTSHSASREVIRIGFLNDHLTQDRMNSFTQVYDVVIMNDSGMEFVNQIIQRIIN